MAETMHPTQGDTGSEARAVASAAKERAGGVAATAGDEARAVADDAKAQARQVVERSRLQLRTQANEQTTRLAGTLREVGDEIRAMTRGEAPPDGMVNNVTTQIAETMTNMSRRLNDGGFDSAIGDMKRYARNHPGMFLLGALGAGFVVGRVVKAADTKSLAEAARGDGDTVPGALPSEAARLGSMGATSSFDESLPSSEPVSTLPPPPGADIDADIPREVP